MFIIIADGFRVDVLVVLTAGIPCSATKPCGFILLTHDPSANVVRVATGKQAALNRFSIAAFLGFLTPVTEKSQ
jgi:hypothetical protein